MTSMLQLAIAVTASVVLIFLLGWIVLAVHSDGPVNGAAVRARVDAWVYWLFHDPDPDTAPLRAALVLFAAMVLAMVTVGLVVGLVIGVGDAS